MSLVLSALSGVLVILKMIAIAAAFVLFVLSPMPLGHGLGWLIWRWRWTLPPAILVSLAAVVGYGVAFGLLIGLGVNHFDDPSIQLVSGLSILLAIGEISYAITLGYEAGRQKERKKPLKARSGPGWYNQPY